MTTPRSGHPGDDVLFALAHGLLPESERERTLAHVRRCAACEDLLRQIAGVREKALADGPPPEAALRPDDASERRWRPVGAWAIAAVAAGFAFLAIWYGVDALRSDAGRADGLWLSTEVELVIERSASAGTPDEFLRALAPYEQRRLGPAISQLEALDFEGGWADLRDVYLCSALVNAGRHADAEAILDRLDVPTLPYTYRMAARWYRVEIYEATDRRPAALAELRSLAEDPGPIGERARVSLERRSRGDQGSPMSTNPDQ